MAKQRQGFLLGLGCNIDPQRNMPRIIDALLDQLGQLSLSRIIDIPPVGMNSHRDFLNAVAFVETRLTIDELKHLTNQVEILLGRDREDPNSKIKDRPADIDILRPLNVPTELSLPVSTVTHEYFLYPLLEELLAYLANNTMPAATPPGVPLRLGNLRFGQAPTTIYRNTDTGQEGVI